LRASKDSRTHRRLPFFGNSRSLQRKLRSFETPRKARLLRMTVERADSVSFTSPHLQPFLLDDGSELLGLRIDKIGKLLNL
jgi:hypothetical protein